MQALENVDGIRVLSFRLLQHRDIRIGVIPQSEKVLIGYFSFRCITRHS